MASQNPIFGVRKVKKPAEVRAEQEVRDRKLALAFVQLGEARGAGAIIVRESGLPRRLVYRAIERELEWARAEYQRLKDEDAAASASDDQKSSTEESAA